MGLHGPPPEPTALRVLKGNTAHRPLPKNEPQFEAEAPPKPKGMSRAGRRVYDELVELLSSARILALVDQRALAQLSEDEALLKDAYQGIWEMVAALKKKADAEGKKLPGGPLIALLSMTSGRLAMASVRDLAARVVLQRREFGLTPASRPRIEALSGDLGSMDALEQKLCG